MATSKVESLNYSVVLMVLVQLTEKPNYGEPNQSKHEWLNHIDKS